MSLALNIFSSPSSLSLPLVLHVPRPSSLEVQRLLDVAVLALPSITLFRCCTSSDSTVERVGGSVLTRKKDVETNQASEVFEDG
ncbi:hypothetical protein P691DRAFT_808948 [Macrolepiota fuliginosa MF-IS2]|uniref:Uncharacterized protein n=1 Tax=Macrolepiota fuliginosa MF-IS2 TaxID=1400762 RepID=A0A9P6BWY8_9AGAR|nr:hypothetical protein P691DRAFT_808948 [Macrolepiota fuliginosa MF-IS2]